MTWCAGRFNWTPSQTRGESWWELRRLADEHATGFTLREG